jgi:hypothetical protein
MTTGFTICPNWILCSKFSPTERAVYVALLYHDWADKNGHRKGWANPRIDRIADLSGASRSAVKTALNVLARVGVIDIEPRSGESHRYWLPSLDDSETERLSSLSRAEIQKADRSTSGSLNPTDPSLNPTSPSLNPTGGRLKSDPEEIQRETNQGNKTNEIDEKTPPPPSASSESPPGGGKTNPASGRSQEEGGQTTLEEEKRIAPAVSSSNNIFPRPRDDFAGLRAKLGLI